MSADNVNEYLGVDQPQRQFTMFSAILRASSRVSNLAAERRPGSSS